MGKGFGVETERALLLFDVHARQERRSCRRKGGVRLPGKENTNSHGARPVHLIITTMKWIRTSRLSTENFLSSLHVGFGVSTGNPRSTSSGSSTLHYDP